MINSCGTGKPTEADGSGRGSGRKRTEAAAAVRAVRAVRAAAALLPRMASGERQRSPHRKELLFCCASVNGTEWNKICVEEIQFLWRCMN